MSHCLARPASSDIKLPCEGGLQIIQLSEPGCFIESAYSKSRGQLYVIEVRHGPADGNVVTMKNDDNSSINIVNNEEVLGNITKRRQRSQRQRRVFGHYFREDVFEQ